MPAHSPGDQRFKQTGVNSAGDPMYSRVYGGAGSSDYRSMSKDELSAELESRGLAKSGNKAELIARLEEDDG